MSNPQPLKGKNALVTGGSRGIGAAIARKLAEDGANVVISYVASADKANDVVADLQKHGVKSAAFKADQANTADVIKLVQDAAKHLGGLDILVNNAGVFVMGTVGNPDNDNAAFDHQYAVNVGGVVAAVRAAVPLLSDKGRIITIGSCLGEQIGTPGLADYSATKFAVAGYTRGWARDLGPRGITVNVIQPGPTDTDMNPDGSEFADQTKTGTALGRYGKPDEIASVVAFIAGPGASYVTGAQINVDGGVNA